MPSTVQQLLLLVWGRLLTSPLGVFSVWMNIVRNAPAMACGWDLGFNFNESTRNLLRVLKAVRVVHAFC